MNNSFDISKYFPEALFGGIGFLLVSGLVKKSGSSYYMMLAGGTIIGALVGNYVKNNLLKKGGLPGNAVHGIEILKTVTNPDGSITTYYKDGGIVTSIAPNK